MTFDSVYEMTNYLKSPTITPTITVNDDLTTDKGWVSNTGSWTYNATGDYIDFATITRSTTAQQIYIDVQDSDYLGSGNNLSNTKWVARFKIKTGTQATSQGNVLLYLGFSNNLGDSGTTQQSVTVSQNFSPTENHLGLAVSRNNFETTSSPDRINSYIYSSGNLPFSTDFYMEMTRDGDDFTLKAYSDEYVTQVGATATATVTGISSLRYLKAFNDSEQAQSYTSGGVRLYNMKIYNGTSTTSSYPKPRGQHFWEYFSGDTLNSRWSSHGSGSASITDDGLLLTSPTNGLQTIDFSPSDAGKIRPFSPTGAVMIVTSKMVQAQYSSQSNGFRTNYYTEAGKYVIMAIQGQTNGNSSDNKIMLKSNNPSTSVDTTIASSAIHDWHTYKLELLSSSSTLNVDGLLQVTGSCNPDTRCQPYLNMATAEGTISGGAKTNYRYCEVYNT
jgi:hypothetical protein